MPQRFIACAVLFLSLSTAHAKVENFDVVVYGGTSGGVIAAVQAGRMGKHVVLIEPIRSILAG